MTIATQTPLHSLKDLWDEAVASQLDEPELLRYRSNLLGSDLRITNFAGGNTSSKIRQTDPLDGSGQLVMWVKGSGGDLGSIRRSGFAALSMDKLLTLAGRYEGVAFEDAMVELYPLCAFGVNSVTASIDTPLHGFLPALHVDHLHPDWGIALAAAANGDQKLAEFNHRFGHRMIWLPWQRPGFELAMMMRKAVAENPGCDGILLGGHGIFTWGNTQRECYLNSITTIDQMGQFVGEHIARKGDRLWGGAACQSAGNSREMAIEIMPYLRGKVSAQKRVIGTFAGPPEVMRFVNSVEAEKLAFLGTSCPDHFIRTKIRPLYVPWNPAQGVGRLRAAIDAAVTGYRKEYCDYYQSHAQPDSPAMRDPNPAVVLIPGLGMFAFGKDKAQSRITGECYVNAIHVMEGASALESEGRTAVLPQAGPAADTSMFRVHCNYVALPPSEAFRIEYWALEDAKLRRQPPERELSRRVVLVAGDGAAVGREVTLLALERGAHVIVAGRDLTRAQNTAEAGARRAGNENVRALAVDLADRAAIRKTMLDAVAAFCGVDIIILDTETLFASPPGGRLPEKQPEVSSSIDIAQIRLFVEEAAKILAEQALEGSIVFASRSGSKQRSGADEAASNDRIHDRIPDPIPDLIREFAAGLSPSVRVNGICSATAAMDSTSFPRDCANAIMFLAGPLARRTTGHLIPLDGGFMETFLR